MKTLTKNWQAFIALTVALMVYALAWTAEKAQAQVANAVTIYKYSTGTNGAILTLSGSAILYNANMFNTSASVVYLMAFDATTYPTNGMLPVLAPLQIPAISTGSITYGQGRRFDNGIILACSSTQGTLTLSTNGWFDCVYSAFH